MGEKVYLGDGVYVDIERGMIKLTTSNGLRDTNTIYLEPDVWGSLKRFVRARIDEQRESPRASAEQSK